MKRFRRDMNFNCIVEVVLRSVIRVNVEYMLVCRNNGASLCDSWQSEQHSLRVGCHR